MKIAEVAPPFTTVPPAAYGGTERVIAALVGELHGRGHDVTLFAPGGSSGPGSHVPTVVAGLWDAGFRGDPAAAFDQTVDAVVGHPGDFDVVHSHLEWHSLGLAARLGRPVVATFHGRLDVPEAPKVLAEQALHPVAISQAQAAAQPGARWAAMVHNGLPFPAGDAAVGASAPRPDDLCFVGRIDPEKGILDAIEIAGRTGCRLRIAAKAPRSARERDYLDAVVRPALGRTGGKAELLGELGEADRDALFRASAVTLMPGAWPEPFGLVAIESLACGTPLVARPVGALPEILRPGRDGFFGGSVDGLAASVWRAGQLDRAEIQRSVRDRFSARRMADAYEALFRRLSGTAVRPVSGACPIGPSGGRSRGRRLPGSQATGGTPRRGSATDRPRSGR